MTTVTKTEKQARQEWRTPDDFFDMVNDEVGGFDIDVAADYENNLAYKYLDERIDALIPTIRWFWKDPTDRDIQKAWCNPPYAKPELWVIKAIEQVNLNAGSAVYMLLNHDASTKWYSLALEHASEIRILTKKRIQFIAPDGITPSSNSKGQCVIVFRKKQPSAPCHVWHWDWTKDMADYEN